MEKIGSIDKPYKCPKCDGETRVSEHGHPHRVEFGGRDCPVCKGEGIVWPARLRPCETSGFLTVDPNFTQPNMTGGPWVNTGTPITSGSTFTINDGTGLIAGSTWTVDAANAITGTSMMNIDTEIEEEL